MDQRFPDEFVTWKHKTPVGVKVCEVFGMDRKSGKVWLEFARQIYSEQGDSEYRVIEHFNNGAPYLDNYHGRISLTHTSHFFAVASLPKTPEVNLEYFSPRAAMGIDAEPLDREQVLKIRSKFLSPDELERIPHDDAKLNIMAWTAKEALFKAALTPGLDFKENIRLLNLPSLVSNHEKAGNVNLGDALIIFPEITGIPAQEMKIFSYESYGCCVTIAISPKAAKFGK